MVLQKTLYNVFLSTFQLGDQGQMLNNSKEVLLIDTATCTQIALNRSSRTIDFEMAVHGKQIRHGYVRRDGETAFATGAGKPEPRTDIPVYDEKMLRRALPVPPVDSIFGIKSRGKIVAFTAHSANKGDLECALYILEGEKEPAIWKRCPHDEHLDPVKWQKLMAQGKAVRADSRLGSSQHAVEWGKVRGSSYLLFRMPEPWQGVGRKPVLYVDTAMPQGALSLDQALAKSGQDIRRNFR